MDVVIVAGAVGLILCGAGFVIVFARLISRDRLVSIPNDPQSLLFSPARYRAMERLLDEVDQKFISSHHACTPRMQKRFRKARVRIFRGYTRQLSDDFSRISKAIRAHMVSSQVDRTALAGVMMREQLRFALQMTLVEIRLILYGFGWRGVDTSGVLHCLEHMRAQLQALVPAAHSAAA